MPKYELRRRTNQRLHKQYRIFCNGVSITEHAMTAAQVLEKLKTMTWRKISRYRKNRREELPPCWTDYDIGAQIRAAEEFEAQVLEPGPIDMEFAGGLLEMAEDARYIAARGVKLSEEKAKKAAPRAA